MALKLVGFLPLAVTIGGLWVWLQFRHLWKGERPVDCKLLRGPGESLRLKMEEFGEQLLTPVVILTSTGIAGPRLDSIERPSGSLQFGSRAAKICASVKVPAGASHFRDEFW
jgi:hypothetical protein